jgi:site-specific recombinase XerC
MTPLAPHLTAYLRERLPRERQASRHTVDAYTYTFKLLFAFTTKRLGVAPSALMLEQLDAPLLLEFLAHLQTERGNSVSAAPTPSRKADANVRRSSCASTNSFNNSDWLLAG